MTQPDVAPKLTDEQVNYVRLMDMQYEMLNDSKANAFLKVIQAVVGMAFIGLISYKFGLGATPEIVAALWGTGLSFILLGVMRSV